MKPLYTRCTSIKCRFQTTDVAPKQFVLRRFDIYVNIKPYQQQLINTAEKSSERDRIERGNTKFFFHDNTLSHRSKQVRVNTQMEVPSCAAYSPDLAPSDYHLFASMGLTLAEQRFGSYEDVKKWFDEWFEAIGEDFTGVVFTYFPKGWKNI